MIKYFKDAGAKKVHLLESKKDTGSNPTKVRFNIETDVETSTRVSKIGKTSVTKMKSLKKNQVHIHDSDLDAHKDWVNFSDSGRKYG